MFKLVEIAWNSVMGSGGSKPEVDEKSSKKDDSENLTATDIKKE
jgi:hypothetical protein